MESDVRNENQSLANFFGSNSKNSKNKSLERRSTTEEEAAALLAEEEALVAEEEARFKEEVEARQRAQKAEQARVINISAFQFIWPLPFKYSLLF